MKRKILVISGSRAEYGYSRPLMKYIKEDPDMDFEVVATNMHLLDEFGSTEEEFSKDELPIDYKVYNTLDGYSPVTMAKSLGIFLLQIPEILLKSKPDIVLVSGDRGEQLMAAIAAAHMNIPVAHIQAGEVSGNIDGNVRHAITKIAHIHLTSNEDAYNRVLNLGEEKFRVFNVGAPLIDEIVDPSFINKNIKDKYKIKKDKKIFLLVQHSVVEEVEKSYDQMAKTLQAINKFDAEVVIVLPTSDAGNKEIKKAINNHKTPNYHIFKTLPRADYISLMKYCDVMIGNSSSAILEAPTFKLPVINIGRRELGRMQASNIINTSYDTEEIARAIEKALSHEFKQKLKNCKNPYGDGQSSKRILKILKTIKIDDKLIHKKITY